MKKSIKNTLFALLGLIMVLAVVILCVWGKDIRTIRSVTQLSGDGYLYEMNYYAGYDLDEVIERDIDSNAKLLEYVYEKVSRGLYKPHVETAGASIGCTSFQALNASGDGYLFGRNYDFYKNPTCVVHSKPRKGYASVSAVDMGHLGYSLEKLPSSFLKKALCIASIYAPMDGINEKGLCVSIMALPKMASQQDSGKHKVGTTIIMRLILDRCANVQEAIELVQSLDIRHDAKAGSGYHYMVADASGDACCIEFDKDDEWKTVIVRKPEESNYMIVTNHLLNPKHYSPVPDQSVGNTHSKSWWRYETVDAFMQEHDGILSFEQAQEILSAVHWKDFAWDTGLVEDTQFSNVYDQKSLTLSMRPWNDYETSYNFGL